MCINVQTFLNICSTNFHRIKNAILGSYKPSQNASAAVLQVHFGTARVNPCVLVKLATGSQDEAQTVRASVKLFLSSATQGRVAPKQFLFSTSIMPQSKQQCLDSCPGFARNSDSCLQLLGSSCCESAGQYYSQPPIFNETFSFAKQEV